MGLRAMRDRRAAGPESIGRKHDGDCYMRQASRVQPDFVSASKNRLQDVTCVTKIPVFRAFDEGAGRQEAQAKALRRLGLRVIRS